MRLPEIQLDDRRFQDLVSEARRRINRSCPEWTEHNVSDPGITLIELFAWMTEMTIYRLNRVPDKLHVELLELLGIRLDPPSAATTSLRFRLTAPPESPVRIPGSTEVATNRAPGDDAVVFQTDEDHVIEPLRPAAYALSRGGQIRDVAVADGEARPQGADMLPFGSPPQVGDALQLGFEAPVARLVMRIELECSMARGAGVDPEDPPLRWEVSQGDGRWEEAEVLTDLTGGFNYGSGIVELQLPARSAIQPIAGHRLHWIRCRLADTTRSGSTGGAYSQPPEIYRVSAAPIGVLAPATHAAREVNEVLGVSDGTPGQTFALRRSPVLKPRAGETLQMQDPDRADWQAWELREDFSSSTPLERHYAMDLVSGTVEFGPAIREVDGGWTQYGAVPPKGAVLRLSSYRHGGGRAGNVAAGTLTQPRAAIPGIDSVTNPVAASGGVDPEALEHARQRAAMEIRTRYRAVTAEDYEFLAGEATPRVARAVCLAPQGGGAIRLHLLPQVIPADRALTYAELTPDEALLAEVGEYLDERRALGATVRLEPCAFRGLSVVVNLQASPHADTARVEEDVAHALYTYLNPLVGGDPTGPGAGWPFGRALNQGELYGIVHAVDGVEFVKVLRIYETDLRTGEQAPKPSGTHIVLEPDELLASAQHIVKATHRES